MASCVVVIVWDDSELGYHYETITTTDNEGNTITSTEVVYDSPVVLEPADATISDDLTVTLNAKAYDSADKEVKTFYYLRS